MDISVEISRLVPSSQAGSLLACLRTDPLVWSALQDASLLRVARVACGEDASRWSIGRLGLLALNQIELAERIQAEPNREIEESLRQKAIQATDEARRSHRLPKNLAEAALLALGLRDRWQKKGTWQGLLQDISGGQAEPPRQAYLVWKTALACLYSLTGQKEQLLKSLLPKRPTLLTLRWISHILLTHCMSEEERTRQFADLMSNLSPTQQTIWLRELNLAGQEKLVASLAALFLRNAPRNTAALVTRSRADELDFESALVGALELQRMALLYRYANQPQNALSLFQHVEEVARTWADGLTIQKVDAGESIQPVNLAQASTRLQTDWMLALGDTANNDQVQQQLGESQLAPLTQIIRAGWLAQHGQLSEAHKLARQAVQEWREQLRLDPFSFAPQYAADWEPIHLVEIIKALGLTAEALDLVQTLLMVRPTDLALWNEAALLSLVNGQPVEALSAAQYLVAIEPAVVDWQRRLAQAQTNSNLLGEALLTRKCVLNLEENPTDQDWLDMAAAALQVRSWQDALTAAEKILSTNPDHGLANRLKGEVLAATGEREEALACFTRATLFTPEDARSWLALASTYEQGGQTQRALETLRAAAMSVPTSGDVHFALAKTCLTLNLYSEALPFLRKAAQYLPEDVEISVELGKTLNSLGHSAEAAQVLLQARQKWPNHPQLAYAHAQSALASGEVHQALSALETALQSPTALPEWHILYAQTVVGEIPFSYPRLSQREDRLAKAKNSLQTVLATFPGHFMAGLLMAEIELSLIHPAEAQQNYQHLLSLPEARHPDYTWRIHAGLAEAEMGLGDNASALVAVQEAAQSAPSQLGVQRLMTEINWRGGLVMEARNTARTALGLAPDDLENLTWFADMAVRIGEPHEAQQALQTALQLDARQAGLWLRLAEVNLALSQPDAARKSLFGLMALEGVTEAEYNRSAQAWMALNEPASALTALKKALAISVTPATDLLVDAAYLADLIGQKELGLELMQQAVNQAPEDYELYILQSDMFSASGRSQAAQACLEHVLRLQDACRAVKGPTIASSSFLPESWKYSIQAEGAVEFRLAVILRQSGDLLTALHHAQQAAAGCPQSPSLHYLVADLAAAALHFDDARSALQDVSAWLQTPSESCDIAEAHCEGSAAAGSLNLAVELALMEDRASQAEAWLAAAPVEIKESSRTLAAHARLLQRKGDIAGAEQMYKRSLQAVRGLQVHASTCPGLESLDESALSIAEAALEVQRWDDAQHWFEQAILARPLEALPHLRFARALVISAERQRLCMETDTVMHAPGQDKFCEECSALFDREIQAAGKNIQSNEIDRWRVRGRVVFFASPQNLRQLVLRVPAAEEAAALAAALRLSNNAAGAIQIGEGVAKTPELLLQLALAHRESDPQGGLELAREAVELRPYDAIYHRVVAILANAANDADLAYQAMQNSLKLWPDETEWHADAARLAGLLGLSEDEEKHLRRAAELNPQNLAHTLSLADMLMRVNRPAKAVDVLEKVSRQNPQRGEVWLALGKAYLMTNRLNEAAHSAQNACAANPASADAIRLSGEVAILKGNLDEALQLGQNALLIENSRPENVIFLSKVLVKKGKLNDALAVIEQAIPVLNTSYPLMEERASLVSQLHGPKTALPLYQQLADQFPESAEALARLAKVQMEGGDLDNARRTALHALSLKPGQPGLALLVGRLERAAGQLDKAVHYLTEASLQSPTDVEILLELGKTYQERREIQSAMTVYQQAMRVGPQDHRAFYHAGLILREAKDYVGAENMLRRAADLAPKDISIHRQLGAIVALNLVHNSQEVQSSHDMVWPQTH